MIEDSPVFRKLMGWRCRCWDRWCTLKSYDYLISFCVPTLMGQVPIILCVSAPQRWRCHVVRLEGAIKVTLLDLCPLAAPHFIWSKRALAARYYSICSISSSVSLVMFTNFIALATCICVCWSYSIQICTAAAAPLWSKTSHSICPSIHFPSMLILHSGSLLEDKDGLNPGEVASSSQGRHREKNTHTPLTHTDTLDLPVNLTWLSVEGGKLEFWQKMHRGMKRKIPHRKARVGIEPLHRCADPHPCPPPKKKYTLIYKAHILLLAKSSQDMLRMASGLSALHCILQLLFKKKTKSVHVK